MSPTTSGITLESLEFCAESEAYIATYDNDSVSPSMAAVGAVADTLDTDPLELDPLYETVDSDALDGLLRRPGSKTVEISFTYAGCDITMSDDGRIRLSVNET
jgi:hypothetical protein